MWVGLDAVEWAGLKHNYGSAEDIPDLLRRCGGPHPDDAHDASSELLNLLFHQGGWVCSAASAALPFVLRLASTPQVPTRCAMLELVAMPAAEAPRIEARFLDPGWAPAWKQALPELLSLLDDPEPEIRRATADVLGVCDSPGESVLPGLLRCWEAEDDPATRLDLVLALGKAALRAPVGRHSAEVFDLLHGLLDSPQAQIRLAAVHALAPDDPALPVRRLDLMLEAVRDPTVELWRHTSSVHTGVLGVHLWAARLIPGPAPTFTLGLLADHHDGEQRIGALAQAGRLLSQWRSPTAALLPRLVARLDDPAPEARFRAAESLACLGPAAAAHADEVAALLSDTAYLGLLVPNGLMVGGDSLYVSYVSYISHASYVSCASHVPHDSYAPGAVATLYACRAPRNSRRRASRRLALAGKSGAPPAAWGSMKHASE
ncbi:HEAT repeat domain-containing protein [Streptomyces sp. NBC_01314]|uniref:HEAT repeat domain-containing protein n=1 Tax=Streptomyces sp. NBC_01314 TaxID=2903821 RepID=UPI0030864969|nr:HEAT repeat domain-containing protein [Streptomyces sp. NBC_01314]